MDKILDILTEIEAEVEWSIHDGDGSEKIMALIHRAMDIAVNGKAHKWPEEKPKKTKDYLVNVPGRKHGERVVMYYSVEYGVWGVRDWNTLITSSREPNYWWELPEVTE